MAGEIWHNYPISKTLYAVVFATSGQVYLTAATGPEVWGADTHDADDYDVTMTETNAGNSQHYIGTFHADYAAGTYRVTIYEQAGGSPADGDTAVAQGVMYWDGTNAINIFTLDADTNRSNNVYDETGSDGSTGVTPGNGGNGNGGGGGC